MIIVDAPPAGASRSRIVPPGTEIVHSSDARVAGAQRRDAHCWTCVTTTSGAAPMIHQRACSSHPTISTTTVAASTPNEKRSPRQAVTAAASRM